MNDYEKMSDSELDALVARRVMKWRYPVPVQTMSGEVVFWRDDVNKTLYRPEELAFSSSMNRAWEVVEKMKAEGRTVDTHTPAKGQPMCFMFFGDNSVDAAASEMPRAICIAALRAKDAEVAK